MKKVLAIVMILTMLVSLTGCGKDKSVETNSNSKNTESGKKTVELNFLYWADGVQKTLVENACKEYEKQTGVHIKAEALPADETFDSYIQTRMASNNLPDVSYMGEGDMMKYNEMGILADIDDLLSSGKIPKKLDAVTIKSPEGKTLGVGLSNQLVLLYYNKDMFDAAGIEYPPTKVEDAWTWDQFVEVAKKLTVDVNGKNATEDGFAPDKIQTYGIGFNCLCAFHQFWAMNANGGGVVSPDGKNFLWDTNESIEGLQNMVDLVYKYHVASPSLYTFNSAIGSVDATIGSGGYAMYTNGSWDLANLSAIDGVNVGVGVLPKMKNAVTMNCGAPMAIYNTSKHLKEAKDFYAYMVDPAKNLDLLKTGAWLPNEAGYYTDQALIDSWTTNLPKDAKETIISYSTTDGAIAQWPAYFVPAYNKMNTEYTKFIDKALSGEMSVKEAFDLCMPTIKTLFESGTVE
ncbi:ABC transporter substrate-binding protein [Anaeromicropila herbilytica]|uniref:Sugar ABC transporter substrate-binding protein n=1 Tax=Anaeromicropila herbilytica TaxID=2785025 RepID=A0A7R7EJQ8_9FIRM|nr:sugar ABC transporter substrate-binding protein [Anaeromicropila herbilytica]BCN30060.1 sugar ABC transporter substrate-binding protein [Anaeromicropila herbilytica]